MLWSVLCAAKMVAKKICGYQRCFALTGPGLRLHFWKDVLSMNVKKRQPTDKIVGQVKKCEIYLDKVKNLTNQEVHKKIRDAKSNHWQVQKNVTYKRVCWLEKKVQGIAQAKGEHDWQKKMKEMMMLAKKRSVSRKMTSALKG